MEYEVINRVKVIGKDGIWVEIGNPISENIYGLRNVILNTNLESYIELVYEAQNNITLIPKDIYESGSH